MVDSTAQTPTVSWPLRIIPRADGQNHSDSYCQSSCTSVSSTSR